MSSSSDEEFFKAVTQSAKMLRRKKKMTGSNRRSNPSNHTPFKLAIILSSSNDEDPALLLSAEMAKSTISDTVPRPRSPLRTCQPNTQDTAGVVTNPTPGKERLNFTSEDEDDEALENFFAKMKTPSKIHSDKKVSTRPFIVSDSEEIEESDFNKTTILNPAEKYSDSSDSDDADSNRLESTVVEISSAESEDYPAESRGNPIEEVASFESVFENTPIKPSHSSRKNQKLPRLPSDMTPENMNKIIRSKMKTSSTESSISSPADAMLRRQIYRDFSPSPRRKPPRKPKLKTPLIKVSSTKCGIMGCPLESLGSLDSNRFKIDLNSIIVRLYAVYNQSIFHYGLPRSLSYIGNSVFRTPCKKMEIYWNKNLRSTAGRCRSGMDREDKSRKCRVEFAPHILDTASRLRDTMLHELIHAANWLIDKDAKAAHGPLFRRWAKQSTSIHPELPKVSTKHTYEINFKYWWECENVENKWCDVKVGRKTNSLKVDRVRCAKCGGSFIYVRFKYHHKEKRLNV